MKPAPGTVERTVERGSVREITRGNAGIPNRYLISCTCEGETTGRRSGQLRVLGLSSARLLLLCLALPVTMVGCSSFPLLHASAEGDKEQVVTLLDEGMDVDAGSPILGTRALMLAAWNNRIDMVRLLLDRGADVNAQDATGWTALHAAAFAGNTEIMQLLLERGAVRSESRWTSYRPSRWADKEDHRIILELMKRGE